MLGTGLPQTEDGPPQPAHEQDRAIEEHPIPEEAEREEIMSQVRAEQQSKSGRIWHRLTGSFA